MSIDGANLGVKPTRALETILGGKPSPAQEEARPKEEIIAELLTLDDDYEKTCTSYDSTTLWLAKQMYLERLNGKEGDADAMYRFVKNKFHEKWKEWDVDFTGFMVGFANNLSLFLIGKPEQENPAILTVFEHQSNGK